ncbi:MAG: radical SAM protein [Planctomycetes bacterium]|nr:radical SAM protein [Planctomycetota bacterium]
MKEPETGGPLDVTRNLIALERGTDELLLANSFHMRPLYVARGKESVRRVLSEAKGRTLEGSQGPTAGLVRMLRDHRILVDPASEKERYDRAEIDARATAPRRPWNRMTVFLLVTESCNLGCVYCLNGSETYRKTSRSAMSPDVAMRSIAACLERLGDGGTLQVTFFGGEPLLNWPLIKEVIRRCEEMLGPAPGGKKIAYHITSNLTVRPPDLIEVIRKHKMTVLSDIDGPPEVHDRCRPYLRGGASHARTAETIRRLVDAGVRVALRATVTSVNQDCIAETAVHHKALGASNCGFVPVCPVNSDREYLPDALLPDPDRIIAELVKVYRSGVWTRANLFPFNEYVLKLRPGSRQVTGCAAPSGTTPVVRVNGDVYLCIYLVGQEKFRYGTATGAWDRRLLDETTAALHVDNLRECRECPWRYACGGGCPVMKLAGVYGFKESPKAREYGWRINCDFTQAVLTELLWDMAGQAKGRLDSGEGRPEEPPVERVSFC